MNLSILPNMMQTNTERQGFPKLEDVPPLWTIPLQPKLQMVNTSNL